jgi:uncharacterized membrane protein YgcG
MFFKRLKERLQRRKEQKNKLPEVEVPEVESRDLEGFLQFPPSVTATTRADDTPIKSATREEEWLMMPSRRMTESEYAPAPTSHRDRDYDRSHPASSRSYDSSPSYDSGSSYSSSSDSGSCGDSGGGGSCGGGD